MSGQDCARCRSLSQCWAPSLSDDGIAVNLIVCRIKRGIDVNRNTKALLQITAPKAVSFATGLSRESRHIDTSDTVCDVQSVMVESLLKEYVAGDSLHPLAFWFRRHSGSVTRWADRRLKSARRDDRYLADDPDGLLVEEGEPAREFDEQAEVKATCAHAIDLIEDGVTLSTREYRVIRFCLSNADESKSNLIDGLHVQLADLFGVKRNTVSKAYRRAVRRLVYAGGAMRAHVARQGLSLPASAHARRAWRFVGNDNVDLVTATEGAEMAALSRNSKASMDTIAWIYGVTPSVADRICRRFRAGEASL